MKKYIKRLKITLMEISKMKNSTLLKKKAKNVVFFLKILPYLLEQDKFIMFP